MLTFSRVVALPQLLSNAMANDGGTSALLSSKQISNIQDVSKKGYSCRLEIGKFSINDGGKSTKEASLGCCIMYGRHYHITLVCGWFLIWWPTIYRWKTIVLLYNWRLTMQCYESDWMVLGVLSKTNWLSLDEKLYFWNRSMAIHSQRAGDAQLIMGQIQC